MLFFFFLKLSVPHSSPVGGGNAPKCWLPTANQIKTKKKTLFGRDSLGIDSKRVAWSLFFSGRFTDLLLPWRDPGTST